MYAPAPGRPECLTLCNELVTQHVPIRHTGHVSEIEGLPVISRPMPQIPEPGDLLVASPGTLDPAWRRALILLLDLDESGAVGVVINRKAEIEGDILPHWVNAANAIMRGGPVSQDGLIGICPSSSALSVSNLSSDFGLMDLDQVESTYQAQGTLQISSPWRLFVGYAGWGPDQLTAEISRGDWAIVPGERSDVLLVDPAQVWRSVLKRQRTELQLWATVPDTPEMN
jgi:putative transcriptional regulator